MKREPVPTIFWDSNRLGTYRRKPPGEQYSGNCDPELTKARAKRLRRRKNRALRGWLPHAQR